MMREKLEKLLQEKIKEIPAEYHKHILGWKNKVLDELEFLGCQDQLNKGDAKTLNNIIKYYISCRDREIGFKINDINNLYNYRTERDFPHEEDEKERRKILTCWNIVSKIINKARTETIKELTSFQTFD
jgi:hypothetical protein